MSKKTEYWSQFYTELPEDFSGVKTIFLTWTQGEGLPSHEEAGRQMDGLIEQPGYLVPSYRV